MKISLAKKPVETIDCTPSWSGILPTMLLIMRDGSPAGQRDIAEEFKRMAALADIAVKAISEGKLS